MPSFLMSPSFESITMKTLLFLFSSKNPSNSFLSNDLSLAIIPDKFLQSRRSKHDITLDPKQEAGRQNIYLNKEVPFILFKRTIYQTALNLSIIFISATQ